MLGRDNITDESGPRKAEVAVCNTVQEVYNWQVVVGQPRTYQVTHLAETERRFYEAPYHLVEHQEVRLQGEEVISISWLLLQEVNTDP